MEGVLGGLGRGRDVGINQMRLSHRRNVGHCPGGAEREGRRWEEGKETGTHIPETFTKY